MITDKFIDSLGLKKDKAEALKDALRKDSLYRYILYKVGVSPNHIERIAQLSDTSGIDLMEADVLEEKARIEWADFIPAEKRNKSYGKH